MSLPDDQPTFEPVPRRTNWGMLLLGALLIIGGLAWLLDATGTVQISLGLALSVGLMLIGLSLLLTSVTGGQSGLVPLGIILALVLTLATSVDVPLSGGIGDRTHRPTAASEVQSSYRLLIGSQVVDLSAVSFPAGETAIEVRQGIGDLTIRLPAGTGVRVEWRLGAGEIDVLGHVEDGGGLDGTREQPGYATAERRIRLKVSQGVGNLEVEQG